MALFVVHLEQPNFTPRAIPMDGVNAAGPPGAGAALPRAKTGSGTAANETSTDPSLAEVQLSVEGNHLGLTKHPDRSVICGQCLGYQPRRQTLVALTRATSNPVNQ